MLDEVPVAFVIGADPPAEIEQAVLSACRQQLADFKVPRQVRVVDEMPRSTLNKIAKAQLRQSLHDRRASGGRRRADRPIVSPQQKE